MSKNNELFAEKEMDYEEHLNRKLASENKKGLFAIFIGFLLGIILIILQFGFGIK